MSEPMTTDIALTGYCQEIDNILHNIFNQVEQPGIWVIDQSASSSSQLPQFLIPKPEPQGLIEPISLKDTAPHTSRGPVNKEDYQISSLQHLPSGRRLFQTIPSEEHLPSFVQNPSTTTST